MMDNESYLIGYIRVSSVDNRQKLGLEVQRKALNALGLNELFEEKCSGRNDQRIKFKKACTRAKYLGRKGVNVVFVVYKLDRLARKTSTLLLTYDEFTKNHVRLKSLKEDIDTSTPAGILTFQMLAIFSEFEVKNLRVRTKEGLAQAKAMGVTLGRPKINSQIKNKVIDLYKQNYVRVIDIAKVCNISTRSVYNIVDEQGLRRRW